MAGLGPLHQALPDPKVHPPNPPKRPGIPEWTYHNLLPTWPHSIVRSTICLFRKLSQGRAEAPGRGRWSSWDGGADATVRWRWAQERGHLVPSTAHFSVPAGKHTLAKVYWRRKPVRSPLYELTNEEKSGSYGVVFEVILCCSSRR